MPLCSCLGNGGQSGVENDADSMVVRESELENNKTKGSVTDLVASSSRGKFPVEPQTEPPALESTHEESTELHVAPPIKPLSAKAASKVCYYLVSHFFGRSMQYKPELLRLSEQVGDFRVISLERLKTFLDAARILVPKDKMAPIARYYAPHASPRTSEAFAQLLGNGDNSGHSQKATMMDVDHLLLDLDKAAMRYYLNNNSSEDEVKPAASVDLARITELVFQILVEDPAFANREISDEEEVRIEELIASVDLATVCIPIGTRARLVKANLTSIQNNSNNLQRSLRQSSTSLLSALGGAARLPSIADYLQKSLSKKEKEEAAPQDSQLVFDVPSWSLRAMQTRQGERNAHLQVQKGTLSLSTPQSQAIQNMLRKRSLIQQQEILAHAVSGAVKAVMLADGKGPEGKDQPSLGSSNRWSDTSSSAKAKLSAAENRGSLSACDLATAAATGPTNGKARNVSSLGKPAPDKETNGTAHQGASSGSSPTGKPERSSSTSNRVIAHIQGSFPSVTCSSSSSASPIPPISMTPPHPLTIKSSSSCPPNSCEIGPAATHADVQQHNEAVRLKRPNSSQVQGPKAGCIMHKESSNSTNGRTWVNGDRPPSSQGPNSSSLNALRVRNPAAKDADPALL